MATRASLAIETPHYGMTAIECGLGIKPPTNAAEEMADTPSD